jgi:glutathione synthase/RimK-type ligase-like ATP-grasp enzyme
MHKPLRIGVVTNLTNGQSYRDLKKSAEALGVVFEQIAVPYLDLSSFTTSELVRTALTYDAVYYRTGLRDTALDHLTSILAAAHIPFINGSRHAGSHRKVQQALIAELRGIPQPKSISMTKPSYEILAKHLGSSFVAKPDFASHGTDVQMIHNEAELKNLHDTSSRDRFIFQELITGADEYRIYMLGNQYIASYKKVPSGNDFRANLHAGGTMIATEPERVSLLARFGTEVAEAFQADIAGLDVFVKDNQCIFLELNWQPGWENLDTITGTKFSNETIHYIVDLIQKYNAK